MRMHLLSGGRLNIYRNFYFADAPREERMELPVSCTLLKHPQGNVLFDTGCHPDAAVNGEARWGELARIAIPIFKTQEAVIGQLPLAGLTAADIDVVVCSHLHMDHCGCNGFFKRATVICHAKELQAARAAPGIGYFPEDWDVDVPTKTIDSQHDVFGDGRLTLLPMPGHTPGMTIAHVVLDRDGAFVLASDAAPLQACLDTRMTPVNDWDGALTVKSLDDIARLQKDGATVLFGHDDAQWRRLKTGAAYYE